jgi:threonylcarbamoyladenosine tRNA methylthiotransferase MtaB
VRRILAETDVERLRLSSIEPQHVDVALLEAWAGAGVGRCLPHLHLPLQSGDDGVLRRMGRRYDTAGYAARVAAARAAIPGVAIHADVIVGFPTEDDEAFARTVDFATRIGFAGLHVFRYSERPGTPATRMAGRVPERVRRDRAATLLELAARARARRAAAAVGSDARVLFEAQLPDGRWVGHAEDHVSVAVEDRPDRQPLGNAIGLVAVDAVDPADDGRVTGRLLDASPGRPLRADLPMLGGVA